MFNKVVSIDGLERVPELYQVFKHTFQSDMSLEEVLELLPLATSLALEPDQVERYRIDQTMVQSFRVPSSGASVLLPKHDEIGALLKQAFGEE